MIWLARLPPLGVRMSLRGDRDVTPLPTVFWAGIGVMPDLGCAAGVAARTGRANAAIRNEMPVSFSIGFSVRLIRSASCRIWSERSRRPVVRDSVAGWETSIRESYDSSCGQRLHLILRQAEAALIDFGVMGSEAHPEPAHLAWGFAQPRHQIGHRE